MNFDAIVAGLPLVLVVLGLVEWVKRLGLAGKAVVIVSMAIGLALGLAYQVSIAVPIDFAGWFGAAVYGIGLGLVASGVYDVGKSILNK